VHKRRILCFGDSLTWGWLPAINDALATRYSADLRWTGLLQKELSESYIVIEEGLNGRTTSLDDPTDPRLNGSAYLPAALASHLPLDLVILMLGTNDTKAYFNRSALEITTGVSILIAQVLSCASGTVYAPPEVLVIAPPPLSPIPHAHCQSVFEGAHEKTRQFGKLYGNLSDFMNMHFLDAGGVISTDGVDGIHFSEENNLTLSVAIARKIHAIFGTNP